MVTTSSLSYFWSANSLLKLILKAVNLKNMLENKIISGDITFNCTNVGLSCLDVLFNHFISNAGMIGSNIVYVLVLWS